METKKVYQGQKLIGEVYYNRFTQLWIAQLDKSISIRSQSFVNEAQAVEALKNFEPSQLEDTLGAQLKAIDFFFKAISK